MKNFISNEDFVRKFFEGALEEKHMLRNLLVIASLIKSYGHKLDIEQGYLQTINKEYPDITKLYGLLHMIGKTNTKDLKEIIKICKRIHVQYRKEFEIISKVEVQERLTEYINKTFIDADITSEKTNTIGIDLKGEGYRYHRNIDRDLDIILQ